MMWWCPRRFWLTAVPVIVAVVLAGLLTPVLNTNVARITIALLCAFPVVLFLWWSARTMEQHLHEVARTLESYTAGSLADRLVEGSDGTAPITAALNRLGVTLQDQRSELRRRSETDTSNSRLLQAVLATMVEGVVVVDADQRVLFTNDAARPLLDFRTRNVLGKHIWEVARSPQIQEIVETLLGSSEPVQEEFELKRTRSIVALNGAPLPANPVPGVVLVLHDVTELRRLENMRRDFVTNVSHELKTPLTSIQAYADTLLSGAVDDPERSREFLERIMDQSDRLYRLILDLLQLAKVESEADSFVAESIAVREVVDAVCETHANIADTKRITVQTIPPTQPVCALVGRRDLRTILDNLIGNAIAYTGEGGHVTIAWVEDHAQVRIDVSDTGMGIAREQQSRVFERASTVWTVPGTANVGERGWGWRSSRIWCRSSGAGSNCRVYSDREAPSRSTCRWL